MPLTPAAPRRFSPLNLVFALGALAASLTMAAAAAASIDTVTRDDEPASTPPRAVELSPLVDRFLHDELTSDGRRLALRVRHGRWDGLDEAALPVALRAELALMRGDLDADAWDDPAVGPVLRARRANATGNLDAALAAIDTMTAARGEAVAMRSMAWRAAALLDAGRVDAALDTLSPLREALSRGTPLDPAELVAAARGLALLARLEGTPSADHRRAIGLLGQARDLDPLHTEAYLAEAELLVSKGNYEEAQAAALEALALHPRLPAAWYRFGRLAAESFNFDVSRQAEAQIEAVHAHHRLLHDLRLIRLIRERDTDAALEIVRELDGSGRFDLDPRMQGLFAAAEGLAFRNDAMHARLARLDAALEARADDAGPGATPRSAVPYVTTGDSLSFARQYAVADALLREAIDREPNWALPHVERGLLLMQWGDLPGALSALKQSVRLDPFHVGAANQLRLVEEMVHEYVTYETERFVIRCRPGIDEVLARDMARSLDAMHAEVAAAFDHDPPVKTQIDLLPDENRFAVRITGLPDLWTIAAATGDVVALTPPRSGRRQHGTFDWVEVLRHEYAHTVTLSRTGNRIPHWFTEACAVWQEPSPRSHSRCVQLANALHRGELFELDAINLGFIRPEKPEDRGLAYAQAEWLLEYVIETRGRAAMIELLDKHAAGVPNVRAMEEVTGLPVDAFLSDFKAWAGEQAESWGLGVSPVLDEAVEARAIADPAERGARIEALLAEHGPRPVLLRLACEHHVGGGDVDAAERALRAYAAAVPVDPYPHAELVRLAEEAGATTADLGGVVDSLVFLDERELGHGRWAKALAEHFRSAGDLDAAYRYAERALQREPYHPRYREFAATVALQRGDLDAALHHLEAMPLLEPDVELHQRRLGAIRKRIDG